VVVEHALLGPQRAHDSIHLQPNGTGDKGQVAGHTGVIEWEYIKPPKPAQLDHCGRPRPDTVDSPEKRRGLEARNFLQRRWVQRACDQCLAGSA
jgi:hypothetical protein